MVELLIQHDAWLTDTGPAALVMREHLVPVEGHDGVVFPATFAATQDGAFKGGYNIDEFPDGKNVCLVDSVGSQANRLEPLFVKAGYAGLVPQVVVRAGEKRVNLLDAGHRAADALVRCSALREELKAAFDDVLKGNAERLAKIAPTSLVFGAWDSRDTQAKVPRLIASTIRAFDVRALTRSSQYVPAMDYIGAGLLEEASEKKTKDAYAERGFVHIPASGSPGGIVATGGIRRDVALHLGALRLLHGGNEERSLALQRYILGLALVAFTYSPIGYLRQGCNVVLDADRPREVNAVYGDGQREAVVLTQPDVLAYAKAAAKGFGIEPDRRIGIGAPDREVDFDKDVASRDVAGDNASAAGRRKARAKTEN